MPVNDRVVSARIDTIPCLRCGDGFHGHAIGRVASCEYCRVVGCACPAYTTSLECATCDHGSPRWAGYSQCLSCLDARVKPCDYVPRRVIAFDAEAAIAEIRGFRLEWEVKHHGWQLDLDRQRLFPESAAPSKHADRHTSLGRKLFYARFRVVRAHPKLWRSLPQESLGYPAQILAPCFFMSSGMRGVLIDITA